MLGTEQISSFCLDVLVIWDQPTQLGSPSAGFKLPSSWERPLQLTYHWPVSSPLPPPGFAESVVNSTMELSVAEMVSHYTLPLNFLGQ